VVTGAQFSGKLDNNGENLLLISASGADIKRFYYNNANPWPGGTGLGLSLVLIAPMTNPAHGVAANWRTSLAAGGTPGTSDTVPFSGDPAADLDGDGRTALMEYALGTSDTVPSGTLAHILRYQTAPHSVTGALVNFLEVQFTRAPGTDAADLRVEVSTGLNSWAPATLIRRGPNGEETWRNPVPNEDAPRAYMRWRVTERGN
jgi:hypothetical protein